MIDLGLKEPTGAKTPLARTNFSHLFDRLSESLMTALFPIDEFRQYFFHKYGKQYSEQALLQLLESNNTRLTTFFTFYAEKLYV